MLLPIYILVALTNFVLIFKKKSSIVISFITVCFIFMTFMGYNNNGVYVRNDLYNYFVYYNKTILGFVDESKEPGYALLMNIGKFFHLDFYQFRFMILLGCFAIIILTVMRFTREYHFVLFFTMSYVVFIDRDQFRNYIAMCVLFIALVYLFKSTFVYEKYNKLRYIFWLAVATMIHFSFPIYSILLLEGKKVQKYVKKIIQVTVVLVLVLFVNNRQLPFLSVILGMVGTDKADAYLNSKTQFGFMIPFSLLLFNLFMLWWERRIIRVIKEKHGQTLEKNGRVDLFVDFMYYLNLLSLIFFPIYMLSLQFYRMGRNFTILNYVAYARLYKYVPKNSVIALQFLGVLLINVFSWLYLDMFVRTLPESVIIPFFRDNLFFNF